MMNPAVRDNYESMTKKMIDCLDSNLNTNQRKRKKKKTPPGNQMIRTTNSKSESISIDIRKCTGSSANSKKKENADLTKSKNSWIVRT